MKLNVQVVKVIKVIQTITIKFLQPPVSIYLMTKIINIVSLQNNMLALKTKKISEIQLVHSLQILIIKVVQAQ